MALNTIDDQINRIETAKANLKTSIVNKGVSIPDTALLSDYSSYVDKISTGIVPTGNIELTAQSGTNVSAYATASVRPASINIDNISFSQSNIGNNLTVTKSSNPFFEISWCNLFTYCIFFRTLSINILILLRPISLNNKPLSHANFNNLMP